MTARLATLALAALLLAGCGGDGDDDGPAEIAFVSSRDGVYSIYVMSAEGKGQRRLTEGELTTGETPSALFYEVEPAWSPDGTQVAFSSRREGNFDVYVARADGTGARRLTSAPADESAPSWSPDGTRIVYQRGNPSDLWVMDADGSGARKLARLDANEHDPAWSPDGDWIAYQIRRPGTPLAEIHLVRPDGTGGRRLTTVRGQSASPAWSPDGALVAFAAKPTGGPDYDVYTVRVDGTRLRRITDSPVDEFEPAFSPDGSEIAFDRGGAIAVVRPGEDVRELTDADDNDGSPAWRRVPVNTT